MIWIDQNFLQGNVSKLKNKLLKDLLWILSKSRIKLTSIKQPAPEMLIEHWPLSYYYIKEIAIYIEITFKWYKTV